MEWFYSLKLIALIPKAVWQFVLHPIASIGLLEDAHRLGIVRIVRHDVLIERANNGVEIKTILPDPGQDFLMAQIIPLAPESGYLDGLSGSLKTWKECFERASDKAKFRTFVTSAFMLFTGFIVDDREATVTFAAQGWPVGSRLALQLRDGPLLRQCAEACNKLLSDNFHPVELHSVSDYEGQIRRVRERQSAPAANDH